MPGSFSIPPLLHELYKNEFITITETMMEIIYIYILLSCQHGY